MLLEVIRQEVRHAVRLDASLALNENGALIIMVKVKKSLEFHFLRRFLLISTIASKAYNR